MTKIEGFVRKNLHFIVMDWDKQNLAAMRYSFPDSQPPIIYALGDLQNPAYLLYRMFLLYLRIISYFCVLKLRFYFYIFKLGRTGTIIAFIRTAK